MLTPIMSGSCIILGIFIIISYFINEKPIKEKNSDNIQQYHLGCYLIHEPINKHYDFSSRLNALKEQTQVIRKQVNAAPAQVDYLNKYSIQLARTFEFYIQQIQWEKQQRKEQVNLVKAVRNAYDQFQKCSSFLIETSTLDKDDCISNWQQYLKCSQRLQTLKNDFSGKLSQKEQLNVKIKRHLDNMNQDNQIPTDKDQFHRQFVKQMNRLDDQRKRLQRSIEDLLQKISVVQFKYQISLNSTKNAKQSYMDCDKHRTEHRLCQQIGQQVKRLGHGSIQRLQKKVINKRKYLQQILNVIEQKQNDNQDHKEMKKFYSQQRAQFTKLFSFFVETKARRQKKCGCTQEEQARLKANYEIRQEQLMNNQTELRNLKTRQNQLVLEMKKNKDARQQLQYQYRKKLNEVDQQDYQKKQKTAQNRQKLSLHQLEQKQVEVDILEYRNKFQDLRAQCEKLKNLVSQQISDIDKLSECHKKKQYYQKIRKQYQNLKQKNPVSKQSNLQTYKKSLKNKLSQIKLVQTKAIDDQL